MCSRAVEEVLVTKWNEMETAPKDGPEKYLYAMILGLGRSMISLAFKPFRTTAVRGGGPAGTLWSQRHGWK